VADTRRVDGKVFQIVGPETAKLRVSLLGILEHDAALPGNEEYVASDQWQRESFLCTGAQIILTSLPSPLGSENAAKSLAAGASPQTPLGAYSVLRALAGFKIAYF